MFDWLGGRIGGVRYWFRRIVQVEANLIPPAIIVLASSLTSKILGMVKEMIFAARFGTSPELGVYLTAFRIPDLLTSVFVLGAFSSAFIPIFARHIEQGNDNKAWKLANVITTLLMIVLVLLSLVCLVLAPVLVRLMVPGYSPEELALTVQFLRIMLLSPILLGVSNVLTGVLNSHHKYVSSALAPIFYNVGIIIGALWLVDWLGMVWGLGLGVVTGAALHALVQLYPAMRLGFRWRWDMDFKIKEVRQVVRAALPRMFGMGVTQVDMFVDVFLISLYLSTASITMLHYANRLQTLPVGLFGMALATAAFPFFVRKAAHSMKLFSAEVLKYLIYVFYFTIPASVFFIVMRVEFVRLLYGLGSNPISWADTREIAFALALFSVSIFAQAGNYVLNRAFFALQDTRTPVVAGLIAVMMNTLLSFLLVYTVREFSMLALSYSIASLFNFILLVVFLQNKVGNVPLGDFPKRLSAILLATMTSGLVLYLSEQWLSDRLFDITRVRDLFLHTAITVGLAGTIYLVMVESLGVNVIKQFVDLLRGRTKGDKAA